MVDPHKDIYEPLDQLVQLDYDAIKAYEDAIEHVDDLVIRHDLELFRDDHRRHIRDLTDVLIELGARPKQPGVDLKGVLIDGMTRLRSLTGTKGALKALRSAERLTARTYEKAANLDLPASARDVVANNYDDERRHLATIEAYLERLGAGASGPPVYTP